MKKRYLAIVVGFFALVFARAYALSYLWAWFALPVFSGLHQLTILQAIGLSSLVAFFQEPNFNFSSTNEDLDKGIKNQLAYYAIFVLLAYLIHWMM